MTTEALLLPFVRDPRRRKGGMPGLVPIVLGALVWTAWMLIMDPVSILGTLVRQGSAASNDTLFLALIAAGGLVCMVLFAVAVGAYVLAMRSLRHTR